MREEAERIASEGETTTDDDCPENLGAVEGAREDPRHGDRHEQSADQAEPEPLALPGSLQLCTPP